MRLMNIAEFDKIADEYEYLHSRSVALSGEPTQFFAKYKILDTAYEVQRSRLDVATLLDFGSGIGNSLPYLREFFPSATLTCADVSARSLEISRSRFANINAEYCTIAGHHLPFNDESFDLIFSACVFHHIPHEEHVAWLAELERVTRRGGLLVIFEHNPLNPLTLAAVRNCPFDEHAELLRARTMLERIRHAGWPEADVTYRLFFPRLLAFARPLERFLRKLPVGAQYFVAARKP